MVTLPAARVGKVAPAAKVVVPAPLRPASVIVPLLPVKETLPELLTAARLRFVPETPSAPAAPTVMPLVLGRLLTSSSPPLTVVAPE